MLRERYRNNKIGKMQREREESECGRDIERWGFCVFICHMLLNILHIRTSFEQCPYQE